MTLAMLSAADYEYRTVAETITRDCMLGCEPRRNARSWCSSLSLGGGQGLMLTLRGRFSVIPERRTKKDSKPRKPLVADVAKSFNAASPQIPGHCRIHKT